MWHWIVQNASGMSFFVTLATLGVWLFYGQLLLFSFQRQRQAEIIISQGWGEQLDAVCLVANMSHEPVFIQQIVLTLRTSDGEYEGSITDFDTLSSDANPKTVRRVTRQGPLDCGSQFNLGTFRSLIRQTCKRAGLNVSSEQPITDLQVRNFKITVMASYGPEGGAIGAQRKFVVHGENNELMRPIALDTKRLKKKAAQRQVRHWMTKQI